MHQSSRFNYTQEVPPSARPTPSPRISDEWAYPYVVSAVAPTKVSPSPSIPASQLPYQPSEHTRSSTYSNCGTPNPSPGATGRVFPNVVSPSVTTPSPIRNVERATPKVAPAATSQPPTVNTTPKRQSLPSSQLPSQSASPHTSSTAAQSPIAKPSCTSNYVHRAARPVPPNGANLNWQQQLLLSSQQPSQSARPSAHSTKRPTATKLPHPTVLPSGMHERVSPKVTPIATSQPITSRSQPPTPKHSSVGFNQSPQRQSLPHAQPKPGNGERVSRNAAMSASASTPSPTRNVERAPPKVAPMVASQPVLYHSVRSVPPPRTFYEVPNPTPKCQSLQPSQLPSQSVTNQPTSVLARSSCSVCMEPTTTFTKISPDCLHPSTICNEVCCR